MGAGSELQTKKPIANASGASGELLESQRQELKMINRSLASLDTVVNALAEINVRKKAGKKVKDSITLPYHKSKLTKLLKSAFGGNCKTTVILNVSPSSYTISETLNTIRFGKKLQLLSNYPQINQQLSPSEYKRLILNSEKEKLEMIGFIQALAKEFRIAKSKGFSMSQSSDAIWKKIETKPVSEEDDDSYATVARSVATAVRGYGRNIEITQPDAIKYSADNFATRDESDSTRSTLERKLKSALLARDNAENLVADLRSAVTALRTQNEEL